METISLDNAVWLEPGSFEDPGGWVLDTQFIEAIGAAYLLAHGLGKPVQDAKTAVRFPRLGVYRMWVYTKDWVSVWKKNCAPGLFQLSIDGVICNTVFGNVGEEWHWQDGGMISIANTTACVSLRDLTGFEGRCGGILFIMNSELVPPSGRNAMMALRHALCGIEEESTRHYDLLVAGGGITGMSCAVTAARRGLKTALIQDRPVFGGNNSSEVRVWLSGKTRISPFLKLGCVTDEFEQSVCNIYGSKNRAENYEDANKLGILASEPNLTLYASCSIVGADTECSQIKGVSLYNVITGRTRRLESCLYADCTGDGVLGAAAGAHFEMTASGHMEMSNFWNIRDTSMPQSFPRCPWALNIGTADVPGRVRSNGANPTGEQKSVDMLGCWYWGSGFEHDPIKLAEYARDTNLRAMYGVWDALKNDDCDFNTYELGFSAHIAGRRESRRLLGDIILTKDDFLRSSTYKDGIVGIDFELDVHTPNRKYYPAFTEGDAFLGSNCTEPFLTPYFLPYRCLYSQNIENLFMAGRCVSVTHDALGPIRVMRTCGMMGEVVGAASAICRANDATPRDVYTDFLQELLETFIVKGE